MRPHLLGSMSKDSHKIVANWLVILLGSMHGSIIAKAVVFRLSVRVVPHHVVVHVVQQEAH
jgi:hypothetical protein